MTSPSTVGRSGVVPGLATAFFSFYFIYSVSLSFFNFGFSNNLVGSEGQ